MRWGSALLLVVLAGCSGLDDNTRQAVENVATFQRGTITDLKAKRGAGPFEVYDVPPDEMLLILRDAAAKARGLGDMPVRAIFVSELRSEVIAKEREPEQALDDAYDGPFRSAMVATVHKVIGDPDQSKVEIHATHRGPFHRGAVEWARDMPRWIDEVIAERDAPSKLKSIPD